MIEGKYRSGERYFFLRDTHYESFTLLAYFSIALKPLTVKGQSVASKSAKRKLSRVSEYDEETQSYTMSAYLIAQLGKNFADNMNKRITGSELLELAWEVIEDMQYRGGGMVTFLEANNDESLLDFYQVNGFKIFDARVAKANEDSEHKLIQLLRIL